MSKRSRAFFLVQNTENTGILSDKVPARSLPSWNLLVMMKPHSLELHSVKNRFRGGRFDNAGQRSRRLCPKAFANERIRIVHITGIPPINDTFSGLGETFRRRQAIGFLTLINGSQRRQQIPEISTRPARQTRKYGHLPLKPAAFW